jgi:hypothetical protein
MVFVAALSYCYVRALFPFLIFLFRRRLSPNLAEIGETTVSGLKKKRSQGNRAPSTTNRNPKYASWP